MIRQCLVFLFTLSTAVARGPPHPYQIQGCTWVSPYDGTIVEGVQGIVTARDANGLWIRGSPDYKDATSDSIYLLYSGQDVKRQAWNFQAGTKISVSGRVVSDRTSEKDLYTTIISARIIVAAKNGVLPVNPVVLGRDRTPPTGSFTQFDGSDRPLTSLSVQGEDLQPAQYGLDFWRSLVGELVTILRPVATSLNLGEKWGFWVYGDWPVTGRNARGGLTSIVGRYIDNPPEMHPEAIFISASLDGHPLPWVHMGARLTSITGIVDYRAGRYTIRPLSPPTVTWVPPDRTEVALPTLHVAPMNAAGCEAIAVASYNAYKMTDEHGAHGMAIHVVKYLHNPAIVFLQEVAPAAKPQNNFGNIATTLDRLCQDIFKISQVLYRWAIVDDIDPSHETYEGLTPRNAYIYNPKTVKLVEPTRGRATPMKPTWPEKVKGRDEYALTNNPGYVEPHQVSPIFRKPLAALFETVSTKTRLWVINVHLQSKRGTGSLYSDLRPPRDPRLRLRVQQMNLVAGFVKEIQKKAGAEANIILAGDFNEWKGAQSVFDPLNGLLLDAAVVTGMDPTEQYTLLHESSALGLDHMFISPSLASPSAGFEFEVLHVNTWSTLLAGRVSDHDPIMGRYQTCRQPGVVTNKQPPGVQPPPDVPMSRDTEVEGVSKIQVDSPSLSKQQVENQWQVMGPRRRRPPKKGRY